MEFSEYVRILRKRWWIIVLAVVLTAGSAVVFSELQHPQYTSTAEVIVNPARPDFGLTQSANILLRPYMTVADSYDWAQDVIDELKLPMTPERLRGNTNFAAEIDRMVIKIEVEDYDGDQANDIARTWANLLVQWRDEENAKLRKEDRVEAILRDQPRYSQSWPPRRAIMLAAGVFFGLAIAGVVVFFLEWLEAGIVRTPQDIERQLGLTVVGAIPSTR
ncbi:MAG: Wzz/FepE/Etk N-terminal domain-containing protein [Chloroflexota bacterium]|nr:Wzz/FepE/Etk N-terminal domain-containing protein [Chloroflexota bacterium]